MEYSPTLEEMKQSIDAEIGDHKLVHTRFDFVDCEASLLVEAFGQIKRAVMLIDAGVSDPKDHKAEAYLLMILQRAWHHGYTLTKGL
jgi:hypothetical protein